MSKTNDKPTDVLPKQLAAAGAGVAFLACLVIGLQADNPTATVLWRAIVAMGGVFVVGYVVGLLAQRMLDDDARSARTKLDAELTQHEERAAGTEEVITVGSPDGY